MATNFMIIFLYSLFTLYLRNRKTYKLGLSCAELRTILAIIVKLNLVLAYRHNLKTSLMSIDWSIALHYVMLMGVLAPRLHTLGIAMGRESEK